MLKELDQDNPVTPAEKNTFRKSRGCKPPKPQRCCDHCTCTCPALKNSSPLKPSRSHPPGAPPPPPCGLRSPPKECKPVKLCPRVSRGHCAVGSTATSTMTGDVSTANGEGGGVELVPLLARRRGLHRPISLSSTDVTKRTPSHDRYAPLKHKSKPNKEQNINNSISIIKNISHMKRLPKNLNCKLPCCCCHCVPVAATATATMPPICCLKRLTLHIR